MRRSRIPDIGSLFRAHFLTGLFVIIPLGVIGWILGSVLRTVWRIHEYVPEAWRPETLFADPSIALLLKLGLTIGVITLLALAMTFLGWISKLYLGRKLLELLGVIIQRIPVIRSVYSALDQLLKAFAVGGEGRFNRVVYVEYPRTGMWTLAFVTGHAHSPALPPQSLNLFIPTTPNPTSGFYLIAPESEVRESGLSVEEAFRVLLSLGIVSGSSHKAAGKPGK